MVGSVSHLDGDLDVGYPRSYSFRWILTLRQTQDDGSIVFTRAPFDLFVKKLLVADLD